jgi:unsaturated rhamnogalacturonyl hydrolase
MTNRYRDVSLLLLAAMIVAFPFLLQAETQPKEFKKWPAGTSALEIGKRVADHLVTTPHTNFGRPCPPPQVTYPEVVSWYGALTFARLSDDKNLDSRLIQRFQFLFGEEARLVPVPVHVDNHGVWSSTARDIYPNQRTKVPRHGQGHGGQSNGKIPRPKG